ncbi:DUF6538 domain-containing protein [Methylobacterium sp. CM6257]
MPYITQSRHGVWKYRRVIPEPLRGRAGKREIVVSLGTKDEQEAELRSLRVHADAEAHLKAWRLLEHDKLSQIAAGQGRGPTALSLASVVTQDHSAVDDWYRGLGFLEAHGLPYRPYKQGMAEHEFDFRENLCMKHLGIDPGNHETRDHELERSPEARALLGVLKKPDPTLDEALAVYLRLKESETASMGLVARRKWEHEKRRVIAYLNEAVGSDHTVSSLTREDVRTYEKHLSAKGLTPGSIRKAFKLSRAIIEKSLQEFDIQRRNPFDRHTISDPTPDREKRLPLTKEELAKVTTLSVNPELGAIARLLVDTGARLQEITGLAWPDVRDLDGSLPFLEIRSNEVRGLKTQASVRVVPLLPSAVVALKEQRQRLQEGSGQPSMTGPVFPRYGRENGRDAASAALMKALRAAGIEDKKKTVHSIRHAVKQQLRDCGCPKDVRDFMQGHSAPNIAENYGLGVALQTMRDWLLKSQDKSPD